MLPSAFRPRVDTAWSRCSNGATSGSISRGSGLRRRSDVATIAAVPELVAASDWIATLPFTLLYEPVALPCSLMKCGDMIHRSTLDLELRGEELGLDWRGVALLASAAAYLFLPPGPIPGFIDSFILSSFNAKTSTAYSKEDVIIGRKLATGGFGSVFLGQLKEESGKTRPVVVKKAKEYGEAEVWMNERVMRIGGKHCAQFVTAFDESSPTSSSGNSPLDNAIWLVWEYEGDNTLYDLMEKKDFPYNMEAALLGRDMKLPKGPRRKLVTIRLIMKQMFEALAACHNSGIVHRDVKPQNCILSKTDNKIKLIDLGAAADLRVGINYVPKEYLLDPRYAPPQQYIMSTQTVRPPPAPVAAFLSPVLWRMETPDRFDMFSCGVTMLQMAFANLRSDSSIILFKRKLEEKYKWDLRLWRQEETRKGNNKDLMEGFEVLSLDNGAPWELLCTLMAYKPRDRPSASDALGHPFFTDGSKWSRGGVSWYLASASRSFSSVFASQQRMLDDMLLSSSRDGQLTEAQLYEELGLEKAAPRPSRQASSTIAWWQERQSREAKKKLRGKLAGVGAGKADKSQRNEAETVEKSAAPRKAKFGWGGFMKNGRMPSSPRSDDTE